MPESACQAWDHKIHWSELLGFVITGITIFVVAVPEGVLGHLANAYTIESFIFLGSGPYRVR